MSIENIRGDIVAKVKATNRAAPLACEGCPNLETTTTDIGRIILTCKLERAASSSVRQPFVGTLKNVLNPSEAVSGDRNARDIREKMDQANEQCPVVESMVDQLVASGSHVELIDFISLLPSPLVSGGEAEKLVF